MPEKDHKNSPLPECFVIMPFDRKDGYNENHFQKVYRNIFKPAIQSAGYKPHRADDGSNSGEINVEILTKLVEAPLVLCDISSLNANVMYELGIRAAFDKPTVTVAEVGTKIPFDFYSKRTCFYRNGNDFNEVPEDQRKITDAILDTLRSESPSLIKLMGLNASASLEEIKGDENGNAILMLKEEVNMLRSQLLTEQFVPRRIAERSNLFAESEVSFGDMSAEEIFEEVRHLKLSNRLYGFTLDNALEEVSLRLVELKNRIQVEQNADQVDQLNSDMMILSNCYRFIIDNS